MSSPLRRPKFRSQSTISAALKSISIASDLRSSPELILSGQQLHSIALKLSLDRLPVAASALLHFYSKASLPDLALKVFDDIPVKDEVCYGAAVVGLAQNRRPIDALAVFAAMRAEGEPSTMYCISGALRASAILAALEQCRVIHAHAVVAGLESNVFVGTGLVDAYGKSGIVGDARKVFDGMSVGANLVTWNAMIAAYGQQGDWDGVVKSFDGIIRRGFRPDEFTFVSVLTACSNAGLVDNARKWIDLMRLCYGVVPRVEHYTCLIGAMARVGQLGDAENVALNMPCKPDAAVWRTLLSGCVVHRNVGMAKVVGQRLLELNPRDDSAYVMLANVYLSAGKLDETAGMWMEMRDRNVKKEGGRSWVEVRGEVHVFISGDRKHEKMIEIYRKLMELIDEVRKLGYVEEDHGLWYHSERLALVFALISGAVPPGKVMRIVKNLRICSDCHEFFKYISRVIKREIVVRDFNRYHRFQDGCCTCRGVW